MLVKVHTVIDIKNSAKAIFSYAANPANWTASNPKEHLGLVFFNKKNRPETGVEFHQKEKVAGVYNDLRGHVVYANAPHVLVWRGLAKYKLLGPFLTYYLPEGGTVQLKQKGRVTTMSHDYYIDFPDSLLGRMVKLFFEIRKFKPKLYSHGMNELKFFKKKLDKERRKSQT